SKRAVAVSGNGTSSPQPTSDHSSAPRVISPLVRQLAKRHDVDITQLTGSGPDGIIRRADVMAAIDQPTKQPDTATAQAVPAAAPSKVEAPSGLAITERVPVTGVRKMIAEQMVRSR